MYAKISSVCFCENTHLRNKWDTKNKWHIQEVKYYVCDYCAVILTYNDVYNT